ADAECRRHYLEYVDVHARLLVHPRYGAGAPAVEPARPRPVRHGWRYLLVAAATLAASLLVQIAWLHPRAPEGGGPPVAAVRPTTWPGRSTCTPRTRPWWTSAPSTPSRSARRARRSTSSTARCGARPTPGLWRPSGWWPARPAGTASRRTTPAGRRSSTRPGSS